jgi:hypothetical protein
MGLIPRVLLVPLLGRAGEQMEGRPVGGAATTVNEKIIDGVSLEGFCGAAVADIEDGYWRPRSRA